MYKQISSPLAIMLSLLFALSCVSLPDAPAEAGHDDPMPYHAQPGARDFIQYWSGWQLASAGENPYRAERVQQIEHELGLHDETILMRSPPWTLLLLAPILSLPFSLAVSCWVAINLLMLFVTFCLIQRSSGERSSFLANGIATAFFYPIWENIAWGQLSILLLLAVAAFCVLLKASRPILAGATLSILSVKAHLFIVLLPALILLLFKRSEHRVILGIIIGFALLVGASSYFFPGSLNWWLESIREQSSAFGVTSVNRWQTATLASWLRGILATGTGTASLWPMWLMPALGAAISLSLARRLPRESDWFEILAPLCCISLAFAPYGWLYDQSLLLITQLAIITLAFRAELTSRRRWSILTAAAGIQLLAIVLSIQEGSNQSRFFWIPLAMFMLWYCAQKRPHFGTR